MDKFEEESAANEKRFFNSVFRFWKLKEAKRKIFWFY